MKCKYCNEDFCGKNCKFLPIRREIQHLIEEQNNQEIKEKLKKLSNNKVKKKFLDKVLEKEGLAPI
jgi:hypothetical protein